MDDNWFKLLDKLATPVVRMLDAVADEMETEAKTKKNRLERKGLSDIGSDAADAIKRRVKH